MSGTTAPDQPSGDLMASAGAPATAPVGNQPATPEPPEDPELLKERKEFEKQLRQEGRRRILERMANEAVAMTSDVGVEGKRSEANITVPGGNSAKQASGRANSTDASSELMSDVAGQEVGAKGQSAANDDGYLMNRKQGPRSPYELQMGTVIPGVLISGINSDLPGLVIGQVSQDVYDSATGKICLIKQGTRVTGTYDDMVAVGQDSAMLAWNWLNFTDGKSLNIGGMGGADQGGYSGFRDQVDNHYGRVFGSAVMLSLVGTGAQLSSGKSTSTVAGPQDVMAQNLGQQISQVSTQLIQRDMWIKPTVKIRPGYKFNIMVNRNMVLEPCEE